MNNAAFSPTWWLESQQAIMNEWMTNVKRMSRLPSLWQKAQEVKKGFTPSEVILEMDRLKLVRYKSDQVKYKTPLIFVFALVNRPYILDLKPGKSVVSHFIQNGFDTYLVDWNAPSYADRHLTLDDYINGYLDDVVDHVCERTGSNKVSLLGYCMGGSMSAMYTALHPDKVKNLIMLAAGFDFSEHEALLSVWSDPKNFDVDRFVSVHGNCPADFLQSSFQMLKPIQNLIEKPLNFLEKLDDDNFVEDYFAMEGWLNDNVPVPGEVYREYVKYIYQQNLLARGQMPVGKHIVNLKNITCPVLNLLATKDHLVPISQSQPFTDMVGSSDRKTVAFPAGHIGLAVGGKAQKELWPQTCEWLAERSVPGQSARQKSTNR